MAKIGFIGMGNMGSAILKGLLKVYAPRDMIFTAAHQEKMDQVTSETKVAHAASNRECAAQVKYLILAVKPQYYQSVIEEIRDTVSMDQILVTIAPGKTLEWLADQFEKPLKIIRTMPNTPAMVKEGMMGMCPNENVTAEDMETVRDICSGFSKTEIIGEHLMDVVTAVSGSSPAYVFMFIEAMADAAVADGMPRAQAYTFAAQAVLGSAKMVLETGKHPGELKDMVCSPGGTTIEAVRVLEEKGMRSAVFEAMKACVKKSRDM